ncbi:type II secretion system protein GspM [Planctomycetota bacterium]
MLNRLTPKERAVLLIGSAILVLLVCFQFLIRPALAQQMECRHRTAEREQAVRDMKQMQQEFQVLQGRMEAIKERIAQQPVKSEILRDIEYIRDNWGLADHVTAVRPTTVNVNDRYQETVIEIKVDSVSLAELVEFVSQLELLNLSIGVSTLEIKTSLHESNLLDATLKVASITVIQ